MRDLKKITMISVLFLLVAGSMFAVGFMSSGSTAQETTIVKVHFINVGQADSILIDCGEFEILIDGGNNHNGDTVCEYLADKVDGNLEIIVATHPDADHIGGLDTVLENYTVEKIIDSGKTHTTKTYRDYMEAVQNEENAIFLEDADMVFEIGDNVLFSIIEIVDNQSHMNNNSVVSRLDVGDISFLFTGDLESEIELEYLDKFEEADVLKAGHHGSRSSSSPEFINKVNPKYMVISCGLDNKYGHPHAETLDTLAKINIITYRTDLQGSIVIETDGDDINFHYFINH